MHRLAILAVAIAALTLTAFSLPDGDQNERYPTIEIGTDMPAADVEMTNVDGAPYTLGGSMEENGLVVVFSCNTCPFVLMWLDRYDELAELAGENDMGFVLVNSNEAKRDGDDSPQAMSVHYKTNGYEVPYLVDTESRVANAFGAKTTPHIFIFDGQRTLAYEGAIDDDAEGADISATYALDAIARIAKGKAARPATTAAVGCSIKRVE